SDALGALALLVDLRRLESFHTHSVPLEVDVALSDAPIDLESAVALLDLAGHPHILAREAAAVLDGSGCVRALAIVVTTPTGLRIVESSGWDERQALAAARKPEGCDVIPLGTHRDEPWQIVADPQPGLEHRCTLIAIRKLLATAVSLDHYRRD